MKEQEKTIVIKTLSELILKAVPKAQTVDKYGGTLYTLKPDQKEGQFCGVFPSAQHVQLVFSQGAKLKDEAGMLEGKGKFRRHINIEKNEDIDKAAVVKLLKEAATLSK